MTKLCPRGKAAAKRKFRVYPSAYANAYASKICAGKIKDPSGVKRKDFRGRKPAAEGGPITKGVKEDPKRDQKKQPLKELIKKRKESKQEALERMKKELGLKVGGRVMREMGGPINKMTPEKRKSLSIRGSRREKVSPERSAELNRERLRKLSIINAKPPRGKSKPVLNTTAQSKRQKMNLELQKQRRKNTMAGGGLMEATQRLRRQGLRGGGICTKGMNRDAVGKNS